MTSGRQSRSCTSHKLFCEKCMEIENSHCVSILKHSCVGQLLPWWRELRWPQNGLYTWQHFVRQRWNKVWKSNVRSACTIGLRTVILMYANCFKGRLHEYRSCCLQILSQSKVIECKYKTFLHSPRLHLMHATKSSSADPYRICTSMKA